MGKVEFNTFLNYFNKVLKLRKYFGYTKTKHVKICISHLFNLKNNNYNLISPN
jgi:hypothetical protein